MANTPLHPTKLIELGKWVDYRDPIWGDSYNWSWNRPTTDVEWLVIHHTVTAHEATPDDIALLHKARGWGGIGYHFVITKDGTVYYVGDVGTARANVLNKNEKVIGITMVGDFTKHNPSDEQIVSCHHLVDYFLALAAYPQLKTWEGSVKGHKELQATQCPGTYWRDVPGVSDTIYERIKNNIPYSPPNNNPTPQPPSLPEPEPDDPCLDLRNKYQQLSRDYANVAKENEIAVNQAKVSKDLADKLLLENQKLAIYDSRKLSPSVLLSFALAKYFNKPLPNLEENKNE